MKVSTFLLLLFFSLTGYAQLTLPIDFESTTISYDFIDFDGGTAMVIANPESSGINTSATVAQIVRDGGAIWGGSKLILPNNIDFSAANAFSMKVYSPAVGITVKFKLEGAAQTEVDVLTTVANQWETLSWDFTGQPSDTYNALVFMFDFGTVGDGTANSTFLFDDIELIDNTGGLSQIDLPVDFESLTVNYTLTDFGGNVSSVVVDPTDPNNTVAQSIKTDSAQTWAGTTIGTNFGFANAIPFSASETKMTARVWSPDANIPIRLKVEDATDPTKSVETETNTTVAMAWETLEFDFSNEAPGTAALNLSYNFDKASIFFNFNTDGATAGEKTYYWDDVQFGGIVKVIDILDAADYNIKIAPNPANSYFYIEFPEAIKEAVLITLFDVSGKLMKQERIQDQWSEINTSALNPGTYFLKIDTSKASYFQKVMIAK